MEAATITQTLAGTLFDPVVLVAAVVIAVALLTGTAARLVELFERS